MYDTDASRSHFDSQQLDAVARLVDAVAHCDESVRLVCEPSVSTVALLDRAEAELSSYGLRCVRVHGPATGGLGVRDLIAEVVGRPDPNAVGDGDLQAGFMTLTEPGEGYERVVLLVTEAHNLQPSALQYVQIACQSSLRLHVVLAGQPSLAATLADDRFAYLRQRITRTFQPRGPMHDAGPGLFSTAPKRPSVPDAPYRRSGSWLPAGLGAAAGLVLLAGVVGWQYLPSLLVVEMHASVPAPAGQAALSRAEASIPAANVPVAEPDGSGHVVPQAEHPPIEAVPPRAAELPDPAELAASQEQTQTPAKPIEKTSAFGPEFGPQAAAAAVPVPKGTDAAIKQGSAPVASDAPVPGPPETPVESRATPRDEPPPPVAPERAVEPPQDAQPVAFPAPTSDAAQPSRVPAPAGDSPVLPQPQVRTSVAAPPSEAPQARHAHREADRAMAPVAALPVSSTDERRCRVIVLYVQLGEELSDADKQFLRDDCHAR